MDPSIAVALADDDHLLDPRVWKIVICKQRDGSLCKDSFSYYKSHTRTKVAQTPPSILQWHFDIFRSLDDLQQQNMDTGRCSFCKVNNASARCFCIRKLKKWWDVKYWLS